MSMLAGLLAKQVMRHAALSQEAGKARYRQLFADTDEYAAVKPEVDQILSRCGYRQIVADRETGSPAETG